MNRASDRRARNDRRISLAGSIRSLDRHLHGQQLYFRRVTDRLLQTILRIPPSPYTDQALMQTVAPRNLSG
jgi:hypothetical protein